MENGMTKELLISIKPEYLVNILNGKKTLELRKTVPKHYKGWVNIYCTKSKKQFRVGSLGFYEDVLYKLPNGQIKFGFPYENEKKIILNGKVVARFWFDEYDTYSYGNVTYPEFYEDYDGNIIGTAKVTKGYDILNEDLKSLCLSYEEFEEYGKEKNLYTWHIKNLEIFNKLKGLSDFYKTNLPYVGINEIKHALGTNSTDNLRHYSLTKAPQSYQFVYTKED